MHLQFNTKINQNHYVFLEQNIIKHTLSPLIWQFGDLWHAKISNTTAVLPAFYLYLKQVKVLCTFLNSSEQRQQLCRWVWVYWFSLCIEEGFPSCWGLCGDVLSVLHLSHSGLSCLSTPSPVWPRFRGADVNHWFAISKLNIPYAFGEVGLFGFGLAVGQHQAAEYSIWWWIIFSVKIIRSLQ